jgi:autoinducer 2-degrading protein
MIMPLVILVEFAVKDLEMEKFRALIVGNAQSSLQREPGCSRFDVLVTSQDPARIVLYEIYDNEGAFDRHLETDHYKAFAKATERMVESVVVRRLTFLDAPLEAEGSRTV